MIIENPDRIVVSVEAEEYDSILNLIDNCERLLWHEESVSVILPSPEDMHAIFIAGKIQFTVVENGVVTERKTFIDNTIITGNNNVMEIYPTRIQYGQIEPYNYCVNVPMIKVEDRIGLGV